MSSRSGKEWGATALTAATVGATQAEQTRARHWLPTMTMMTGSPATAARGSYWTSVLHTPQRHQAVFSPRLVNQRDFTAQTRSRRACSRSSATVCGVIGSIHAKRCSEAGEKTRSIRSQ